MKTMTINFAIALLFTSTSVLADVSLKDLGVQPDSRPEYSRPGKAMDPPPAPKRTSPAVDNAVKTWKEYGRPTPIFKDGKPAGASITIPR